MTDEAVIAYVIDTFEAGHPPGVYTDHPNDLGGPTRWGITRRALAAYFHRPLHSFTADDIKAVTRDFAIEVCVDLFVMRTNLWRVDDWRPRLVTVDFCVNAGADDGVPALQRSIHTTPDGDFGPVSAAKMAVTDPLVAAVRVIGYRLHHHRMVVRRRPRQVANLSGWVWRCETLLLKIVEGV